MSSRARTRHRAWAASTSPSPVSVPGAGTAHGIRSFTAERSRVPCTFPSAQVDTHPPREEFSLIPKHLLPLGLDSLEAVGGFWRMLPNAWGNAGSAALPECPAVGNGPAWDALVLLPSSFARWSHWRATRSAATGGWIMAALKVVFKAVMIPVKVYWELWECFSLQEENSCWGKLCEPRAALRAEGRSAS